jgi:hypothetical protein
MRGGTTSLGAMLGQHPDVYVVPQEVHYFNSEGNFARGIGWYASHFRDAGNARAIGEKTPAYCYLPKVPPRIAAALPGVRLLWILRAPADRAYSHYWRFVTMGREHRSFERALELESRRTTKDPSFGYVKRGVYVEQVRMYLEHFEPDRMKFVLFENLVADPQSVLGEVCGFLGVERSYAFEARPDQRNEALVPRSVLLNRLAYGAFRRKGSRALAAVRRANRRPGRYPPMAQATRERLEAFFAPRNAELADLLGLDLRPWTQQGTRA